MSTSCSLDNPESTSTFTTSQQNPVPSSLFWWDKVLVSVGNVIMHNYTKNISVVYLDVAWKLIHNIFLQAPFWTLEDHIVILLDLFEKTKKQNKTMSISSHTKDSLLCTKKLDDKIILSIRKIAIVNLEYQKCWKPNMVHPLKCLYKLTDY